MKKDGGFVCKNCGAKVGRIKYGGRFRNHCSRCLFSLHVDKESCGDRRSKCGGIMVPIGYFLRRTGEYVLVHKCTKCNEERFNRVAADDDLKKVLALVKVKRCKGKKVFK